MDLSSIWSIILSLVSESGVWAMLFLALLIILIKSNSAREAKYQEIITKLGSSLKKVEEIKEDVEDLKFVSGIGGNSRLSNAEKSVIKSSSASEQTGAKEKNNESKTKNENV
jgi:hypothetical protein